MPNIGQILQNHPELGSNYQFLGKSQGSFLKRKKSFLSYNNKTGWDVIRLNAIQLFLRKYFGFYRSTHLKTIAKAWSKVSQNKEYRDNKLNKRIHSLWEKKFPNKIFPYALALGNSSLEKAEVICIAEQHGLKSSKEVMAHIINRYYREGDIILLESLKAGTEKRAEEIFGPLLKKGLIVKGWDVEGLDSIFNTVDKKYEELIKRKEEIVKLFPGKQGEAANYAEIQVKLNQFSKDLPHYFEYFISDKKLAEIKLKKIQNRYSQAHRICSKKPQS